MRFSRQLDLRLVTDQELIAELRRRGFECMRQGSVQALVIERDEALAKLEQKQARLEQAHAGWTRYADGLHDRSNQTGRQLDALVGHAVDELTTT